MNYSELKLWSAQQMAHSEYLPAEIAVLLDQLLVHRWALRRLDFIREPNLRLSSAQIELLERDWQALAAGMPLQYLLGEVVFRGLPIKVGPGVLIPRPETEELVDLALKLLTGRSQPRIIEVGTGSGCIALSLKKALPEAQVLALDLSPEALHYARANARGLDLAIDWQQGDFLAQSEQFAGNYDLLISNPPYIPKVQAKEMSKQVKDYEPEQALFVEDHRPLVFYQALSAFAQKYLAPQGHACFEINQYLAEETLGLLKADGWKAELQRDLYQNWRFVYW